MSQVEVPAITLARLLRRYLWIAKDDGSLANICVGQEWYDRELLRNYDGQITVGIERNEERKLCIDGNLRHRLSLIRVNVWIVDKPERGLVGRAMRDAVCADVNRVIRQKRNKPNTVDYNYMGVGTLSDSHKAFSCISDGEPSPADPGWIELADSEYQKIWSSDDNRLSKQTIDNAKCALLLFGFKIDADDKVLKELVLKFEGYATAPAGNGVTIKVWSHAVNAWQNAVSGTAADDEVLTITLAADLSDYVDETGRVYLLAKTTNPSNGGTAAVLHCDYVEIVFAVNGITYADITGFRDADEVRVKPFLWRTEFMVKTWLFETVYAN